MKKMLLRMDDVGASSKMFEVYSKRWIGNILFLKYMPPFKAWGPYRELTSDELEEIANILKEKKSKLLIGITAAWVEKDSSIIPYPIKFPQQAKVIKQGLKDGVFEIANHGLSHCIIESHLPKYFSSNRKYHREFFDGVSLKEQEEHIQQSQKILENFFQKKIDIFVPPGNLWTRETEKLLGKYEFKFISNGPKNNGFKIIKLIDFKSTVAFHDREIVLKGIDWLRSLIEEYKTENISFDSYKSI